MTGLTLGSGGVLAFGCLTQPLAATRFFLLVTAGGRLTAAHIQASSMAVEAAHFLVDL
jgi:hypothetical protein